MDSGSPGPREEGGLPALLPAFYYVTNFLTQGWHSVKRPETSVPRAGSALSLLVLVPSLLTVASCENQGDVTVAETEYEHLTADYVEAWKDFYPTSAVRLGLDQTLSEAEDRSVESVGWWIEYNSLVLDEIAAAPQGLTVDLQIDLRLMRRRVESELRRWRDEQVHVNSPAMYSGVISGLVRVPQTTKRIGGEDLAAGVARRVEAVSDVCEAMVDQLRTGPESEIRRALGALRRTSPSLESLSARFPNVEGLIGPATEAISLCIDFLENNVELTEDPPTAFPMGRERFAEELLRYYDMEITPEEVANRALREIEVVRDLIAQTSQEYWGETYPGEAVPADVADLVARVSADMEENRPSTQQESLDLFTLFAEEAEAFVREKAIATLPANRTLTIVLTPERVGPSGRIGSVNSPPPFDPEPMTVLSLPTIPDSFPAREKEDFYRSFNNHFNKFIIIHELFPGHYMQLKVASANPRLIRTFFPYQPYVEGWATLVEKIALDEGFDDFNKLTYLAHLRKRLENANRAYTSVQVHCNGWTEDQVRRFSEEEVLLAPQFAASLFGRLRGGAMQMTSYFMGKDMFMEVLDAEMERLGDEFEVRVFTDVILNAGAVPMDMLPALLASKEAGA